MRILNIITTGPRAFKTAFKLFIVGRLRDWQTCSLNNEHTIPYCFHSIGRFQPTSRDANNNKESTTSGGRTKEANERYFVRVPPTWRRWRQVENLQDVLCNKTSFDSSVTKREKQPLRSLLHLPLNSSISSRHAFKKLSATLAPEKEDHWKPLLSIVPTPPRQRSNSSPRQGLTRSKSPLPRHRKYSKCPRFARGWRCWSFDLISALCKIVCIRWKINETILLSVA